MTFPFHLPPNLRQLVGITSEFDVPPHRFERLQPDAELVAPPAIALKVSPQLSEPNAYALSLTVRGKIEVRCERCMKMFEIDINLFSEFIVAKNIQEADRISAYVDENIEVLVAEEIESTLQLCEDEILLAIPFSPRCSEDCKVKD